MSGLSIVYLFVCAAFVAAIFYDAATGWGFEHKRQFVPAILALFAVWVVLLIKTNGGTA